MYWLTLILTCVLGFVTRGREAVRPRMTRRAWSTGASQRALRTVSLVRLCTATAVESGWMGVVPAYQVRPAPPGRRLAALRLESGPSIGRFWD